MKHSVDCLKIITSLSHLLDEKGTGTICEFRFILTLFLGYS